MSTSRKGVNLLRAVIEHEVTTVLECGGSFTGEVVICFLEHLQAEFGEKLIMLLDQSKFFASDEQLGLVYIPTSSPDLNATEEYLKRLKQVLRNHYLGTFDEIYFVVWSVLNTITHLESISTSVREYNSSK